MRTHMDAGKNKKPFTAEHMKTPSVNAKFRNSMVYTISPRIFR